MLALPERTRAAYLAVKRPGRGVRLNRVQRAAVWNPVEAFDRAARMQGRTTFELLAARAADILADPVLRAGAPPTTTSSSTRRRTCTPVDRRDEHLRSAR